MLLMLDNYDSFTYNLVQYLQALGAEVRVERNDALTVDEIERLAPERIVISPGPCTPNEAGVSMAVIERLGATTPILGVCLGHQTLSHHSGVTVGQARRIMHGKTSDIRHDGAGLFQGLPNPMQVGRYHSLAVHEENRTDLPFTVTARTERGEVMALAFRDRPWVGVQFHPESVLTPDGPKLLKNFLSMCDTTE